MAKSKKKSSKQEASSHHPERLQKASATPTLYENLLKVTRQFVSGKGFHPCSADQLIEKLSWPLQHRELFSAIIEQLTEEGLLLLSRGRYHRLTESSAIISGTIKIHPRGFGFVKPRAKSQYDQDIFIPKPLTLNAVDGDTVEVAVNEAISSKGPEGKVTAIIERCRTHIAGIIDSVSDEGAVSAYVPLLGSARPIEILCQPSESPKVGDRVVMKVLSWGNKDTPTCCVISHQLGHISDPSADTAIAIEEYNLSSTFPSRSLLEAQSFGLRVSQEEIAQREDLRELECVTIDPDTAKDFDDAISLRKDRKGTYHLGVHIADVSHYVQPGSALDKEARQRCNSTYFPGYCLPMLPAALSENLCSLKPNVNRLAVSIYIHLDKKGKLINYSISRTVIKSRKRFTYREAKAVLDGKKRSKHAPLLILMRELCYLLKVKRRERGCIELSLPELAVIVDKSGTPLTTDYISYDITHQMIEEFMLKANEVVAMHMSKEKRSLAYRVHEEPSEENMSDFTALASAFGYKLSKKPTPSELQLLFDEAIHTPHGQYLSSSYIRKMRQALYSAENSGHFGLGLTHYCHFTSPIRRYIDLLTHRSLFSRPPSRKSLDAIALGCSEQERVSAKAESSVLTLKKLRLLESVRLKDKYKQYDAVVTTVKPFGFFFEVVGFMLEGFLHVSALDEDYFSFNNNYNSLHGRHTGKIYRMGDKITVMLQDVDLIFIESKWALVGGKEDNDPSKSRKRDQRPQKRGTLRHASTAKSGRKRRSKKQ